MEQNNRQVPAYVARLDSLAILPMYSYTCFNSALMTLPSDRFANEKRKVPL